MKVLYESLIEDKSLEHAVVTKLDWLTKPCCSDGIFNKITNDLADLHKQLAPICMVMPSGVKMISGFTYLMTNSAVTVYPRLA